MKAWHEAINETGKFVITHPGLCEFNIWPATKSGKISRAGYGLDIRNELIKIPECSKMKFGIYKNHVSIVSVN